MTGEPCLGNGQAHSLEGLSVDLILTHLLSRLYTCDLQCLGDSCDQNLRKGKSCMKIVSHESLQDMSPQNAALEY